jgi:GNAT superfamily N-acetyltransferase
MPVEIRPYQPEDTPSVVALNNQLEPEYPQTESEFRWHEENREERCKWSRWVAVAEGVVIGAGEYSQYAFMYHPQKFNVEIGVHPEHRCQGIGTALYDTVTAALEAHDPILLRTAVREDRPAAMHFATKRGYVEAMREWESRLDVAAFDPAPFRERQERVATSGIRICTVAELASDPDRDRKLYEMEAALEADVPSTDVHTPRPFEEWVQRTFENPSFIPEAWIIAVDGDEYVGCTALSRMEAGNRLETGLTGVLRSHRRRGIALALKLRAIEYARSVGAPEINTWNATTNEGMLSINVALGFARQPAWIEYEKSLRGEAE